MHFTHGYWWYVLCLKYIYVPLFIHRAMVYSNDRSPKMSPMMLMNFSAIGEFLMIPLHIPILLVGIDTEKKSQKLKELSNWEAFFCADQVMELVIPVIPGKVHRHTSVLFEKASAHCYKAWRKRRRLPVSPSKLWLSFTIVDFYTFILHWSCNLLDQEVWRQRLHGRWELEPW